MKIEDIENICWICRRTREELEKPFEYESFSIPLNRLEDQIMYSGYYICDVCESIIATIIGRHSDEYIDYVISEKIDDIKERFVEQLTNVMNNI